MKITVRWLIGIVATVAIVCAMCQPRWRLCSREIRHLAEEERLFRGVAARIDMGIEAAAAKGDTKQVSELAEMAVRFRRLADRRARTQEEWAMARWMPFLPHPFIESDVRENR